MSTVSTGMMRTTMLTILIVLLAAMPSGCGYKHVALYDEGYRSVAVPIFENSTFWRGVEFDLKEALVKQIELKTPYKVTAQDRADTLLVGRIVNVEQRELSRREEGALVQELEWTLIVDFEWTDQRDGRVLRQRKGFTSTARYIPAREGGEPYQVGQHGAVARMADSIVSAMAADW